ncbi:MAG: hypothetical protein ACRCVJ_18840 [Clostridium sp.]|uniref:hypothetical protein n=1 Tax=Clostridium sp. TaxID=1506 RepID=UPI003F3576E3
MRKKDFREKINANKKQEQDKKVVQVNVSEDLIVNVDMKKINKQREENNVIGYIIDLFNDKKHYRKGEKILLSQVCDCMYDLIFMGFKETRDKKIAYMNIC